MPSVYSDVQMIHILDMGKQTVYREGLPLCYASHIASSSRAK